MDEPLHPFPLDAPLLAPPFKNVVPEATDREAEVGQSIPVHRTALSSATSCWLDAVCIMSSNLVATAFEEHDACASGWRYDTSPPNGILPVNRLEILGGRRERTLNQQFGGSHIRHRVNAFTRVNAQSALQRPMCKRADRQGLPASRHLTGKIAGCKLFLRRVSP